MNRINASQNKRYSSEWVSTLFMQLPNKFRQQMRNTYVGILEDEKLILIFCHIIVSYDWLWQSIPIILENSFQVHICWVLFIYKRENNDSFFIDKSRGKMFRWFFSFSIFCGMVKVYWALYSEIKELNVYTY